MFITDTFDHQNTDSAIAEAIEQSGKIHTLDTTAYIASILRASSLDTSIEGNPLANSISAILRGIHPDQIRSGQMIARPVSLKFWPFRRDEL